MQPREKAKIVGIVGYIDFNILYQGQNACTKFISH